MEVLHPRCAGLDVHQQTVVVCARIVTEPGVAQHVETFETTTQGLEKLHLWLAAHGCTHVAMESTGVYWKPVWHMLEGHFVLVLAHGGAEGTGPSSQYDGVRNRSRLPHPCAHPGRDRTRGKRKMKSRDEREKPSTPMQYRTD